MANILNNLIKKRSRYVTLVGAVLSLLFVSIPVYAAGPTPCGGGSGEHSVQVSIDLGCKGHGNPISDMAFAIIRLLSIGVGLVVVGSIIVAGIQYTTSQDDPKATAAAEGRIKSAVIALLIYIFAFAILNYVIPAGFFRSQ